MLDWLALSGSPPLFVSAVALFTLALILLALLPSRNQDAIARRISALHPSAAPFRRHVLEYGGRLAAAVSPVMQNLIGPAGRQQLARLLGEDVNSRVGYLLLIVVLLLGSASLGILTWTIFAWLIGDIASLHWGCTALGALTGAYLPDLVLRKIAEHRLRTIELGLPDALDLLVICAEAGLSFETALQRVAGELRLSQPALAAEFATTSADLRVWSDRDAALAALATRAPIKGMQAVVTTLIYSMRYGTPLVQTLRVMASALRNEALLHLEERAGRLPSLMTIPMIVFTLPATFLVLVGPAALRVWDTLHK